MRSSIFTTLLLSILCINHTFAQEGEKVTNVKILTVNGDSTMLPFFGERNLILFYADPSKPNQNLSIRNYLKEHPIVNKNIAIYGVINMAAAPMIPQKLIINRALKEASGNGNQIYVDPKELISKSWHLTGANQNFAIIGVSKEGVIDFYKTGQLSSADQADMFNVIHKYENN